MKVLATLLFATLGWFTSLQAGDIHFKMSPNPASTSVSVDVDDLNAGDFKIEVYNVIGTLIAEYHFHTNEETMTVNLNIAKYQDGVYLLRVSQNNNTSVKRLKVQHTD